MTSPPGTTELWDLLETYRQRYPGNEALSPLADLERSIRRRRVRSAALTRRLEGLDAMVRDLHSELDTIEAEITGSRRIGSLLIEEVIDRVREETGEAWSPTPIHGFRAWGIEKNQMTGVRLPWPTPLMVAKCLQEMPGEDLPHPATACGPPSCGIYAVKDLNLLGDGPGLEMADGSMLGVVAMTGKVIEHEHGYRASHALVAAAVVTANGKHLMTDDPETIERLFADPRETVNGLGMIGTPDPRDARVFLESARAKEERWISEKR